MLCLAPIELVTDAERRLYTALSSLSPGSGVLGGLVVFVPVVDGAMQRRQADAVAFLPETVVVVRAVGMGRQAGELRPSATGVWTVGGEVLRLSGGGSNPAGQLHRAVALIHATLDSGGIDAGSPAALAVIDGPITSVRDRSAGGPIACSMDTGEVLTGLRHCANVGSRGDHRVWTTADVKAALGIFGLPTGGPSVEALNNEGFLFSPYVLRRPRSAVGASADLGPMVSLLSGPFAQPDAAHSSRSSRPAVPDWHEPDSTEGTDTAPRGRSADVPAAVQVAEPALEPVPDDGGVGGLFADARPAGHSTTSQTPKTPRTRAGSTATRPGRAGRRSPLRLLFAIVAVLLLAALAGLVIAAALGGADPVRTQSPPTAEPLTPSAEPATTDTEPPAQPTQATAGPTYSLLARRSDVDCAANSYGQVAEFFATTPCSGLTRTLFTTTLGDAPAVVSVSIVAMPDVTTAADLRALVDASGTGNVSDLLRAGVLIEGGPTELVAAAYASELTGTDVRIVEVAWVDAENQGAPSLLEAAADDALLLEVPTG